MLLPTNYICPHCAQSSQTTVDPSQGQSQSYVEDCQVCCRPLLFRVGIENDKAWIEATPESD